MNLLLCERCSRPRFCMGHRGLRHSGLGCRTIQAKFTLQPLEREDLRGS